MNNIQFDYPASYLLLCAVIALVYAIFMYYGDGRWRERSKLIPIALGIGRSIVVFILCVLLLSPFITYFEEKTELPVVVLAHDASESISLTPDSVLDQFIENHEALASSLSEYELSTLAFGEAVRPVDSLSFSDKKSNISALFDYLQRQYAGRNIGAIILASDGLYNVGQNPVYATSGLNAPLFTIPLGDTSSKRDIAIPEVFHNQMAFLGDKFNIQVDIEASQLSGNTAMVRVQRKTGGDFTPLDEKQISINEEEYFTTLDFTLPAKQSGLQQYRVTVSQLEDEISYRNNTQDFFIDIIDSRQKILILAGSPHPDVTAIRQLLSENDNYEVDLAFSHYENIDFKEYDLLFLHQIPFEKLNNATERQALASDVPKIFITGLSTDLSVFNNTQSLIRINQQNPSPNAVEGSYNENFNAFILSENTGRELQNYPPIETFFGDFNIQGKLSVLFYQQIGEVKTEYPLIGVGEEKGKRIGFILGEGLWRWRLYDHIDDQDHQRVRGLLEQLTQYVSLKEDKRRFRVSTAEELFDENERIRMRAEFFNENYELINDPEVQLTVTDEQGNNYDYVFGRENNFYTLDLGFLPAGNYQYSAKTTFNGREFKYNGRFSVETIQLEMYKTKADHNLLRLLARQNGGMIVNASDMLSIPDSLETRDVLKPVLYSTARTKSMINLPLVFWIMAILLALEWISRRLAGTY